MSSAKVKQMVQDFRVEHAYGNSTADCFAPWYLEQSFDVPNATAIQHSSDGGPHDLGIDAFHILIPGKTGTLPNFPGDVKTQRGFAAKSQFPVTS